MNSIVPSPLFTFENKTKPDSLEGFRRLSNRMKKQTSDALKYYIFFLYRFLNPLLCLYCQAHHPAKAQLG